jgi:two-component system response regulator AlgR
VRTFAAGRGQVATTRTGQRRTHLCARMRGSLRLIPIEDVHYLQAEEKYVVVHHARGEDLIEESLKTLEDEFGERFVRIHRNCLVARAAIRGFERSGEGDEASWLVVLEGIVERLPVSRRQWPVLRELAGEK